MNIQYKTANIEKISFEFELIEYRYFTPVIADSLTYAAERFPYKVEMEALHFSSMHFKWYSSFLALNLNLIIELVAHTLQLL